MIAASEIGTTLGVKYLCCFSQSGDSAKRMSRLRSSIPLLVFTPSAEARRQLALSWGVEALLVPTVQHTDDMVDGLFREFLTNLHGLDLDLMLEIKNKEASALRAVAILRELGLSTPAPNIPTPPLMLPADPTARPKVKRLPRQPTVAR